MTCRAVSAVPRTLLAAYQCGPGMGSVSQIGWEWYARLAKRVPTTLVTHIRNRPALQQAGAPLADSEIFFIDTEWFACPLYRCAAKLFPKSEHAVFLVSSLDFFVYDWQAVRLLKHHMRQSTQADTEGGQRNRRDTTRWDVVHVVTPVSSVAPTRLYELGLPLIVGPLNSGIGTPAGFPEFMREDSAWLYPIRRLGRVLDSAIGSTRHTTTLLTATQATVESIPPKHRARCIAMLENGVDLQRFHPAPWPAPPSADEPLRVLFVGRLVPFKGIPMLLDAVAQVQTEFPVSVTIAGTGPMLDEWKQYAAAAGLNAAVSFLGNCSLDEVADQMRAAHLFCLPSVRESGGAVLLEAMAAARPVVAVSFGGPAEIVDDTVGRGLAPHGTASVTAALADTLRDVVRNPDAWRQRGTAGRERAAARYDWDAKVETATQLYQQVVSV